MRCSLACYHNPIRGSWRSCRKKNACSIYTLVESLWLSRLLDADKKNHYEGTGGLSHSKLASQSFSDPTMTRGTVLQRMSTSEAHSIILSSAVRSGLRFSSVYRCSVESVKLLVNLYVSRSIRTDSVRLSRVECELYSCIQNSATVIVIRVTTTVKVLSSVSEDLNSRARATTDAGTSSAVSLTNRGVHSCTRGRL